MATLFLSLNGTPLGVKRRVVGLPTISHLVLAIYRTLFNIKFMRILRAIGLGLVIIILSLLTPRVFHSFEDTLVATFNTAQAAMSVSRDVFKNGPYPLLPGGR